MAATIWEHPESREFTLGPETGTREKKWRVGPTTDEEEVRTLAEATIPALYLGLIFQNYTATPATPGLWEVSAKYGKREPREKGTFVLSFSTTGGTAHIIHSKETKSKISATASPAPDFKQLIGVNGDSVAGCDVVVPQFEWQETHTFDPEWATMEYAKQLRDLTGKVNAEEFRGFAPKEVLFKGASGSYRDGETFEATFTFAAGENVGEEGADPITIGDIEIEEKDAWDYLWVRHADEVDGGAATLVKRPVAAYVERVCDEGDFELLYPWNEEEEEP